MSQISMAAFIVAVALVMHLPATSSAAPAGALTEEFFSALRDGYEMDAADRGRHNAISNNAIDQSREHGLMEHELFDYETLFDIEMPFSKSDRLRFNAGASDHAMILTGVDLKDGKPRKWLVENSWGDEKGNKGKWTLYDRWFDEHVYTVIVHKDHVPADVLSLFEQEAEVLPTWYPGAGGPGRK